MALFDHFHNVYDVAFKPRLLRTLLKDHVPDQNQPFRSPSDLPLFFRPSKLTGSCPNPSRNPSIRSISISGKPPWIHGWIVCWLLFPAIW
ncbi:hypothetical protein CK203_067169 [Vitis vinifera]|uniref:Uncharacterized protein n=1 Tax=Vitis vinifera TaxID=29760 RepID=A0A438EFQ2_VITVI|nr:hypothetical protein CK203_067169 [Vitis vinifera]